MIETVSDRPGVDDPIWEYVFRQRVEPYIPRVREWWNHIDEHEFVDTGIIELDNGLYVRFTRVAARSPIKGIQAFPFIPTGRLQLSGVQGGSLKMVERLCIDNRMTMDEFTIISKVNLPSTFGATQFLAFIPTELLEDTKHKVGVWLYFKPEELSLLARGETNDAIKLKALLKA